MGLGKRGLSAAVAAAMGMSLSLFGCARVAEEPADVPAPISLQASADSLGGRETSGLSALVEHNRVVASAGALPPSSDLRVMSFNVRVSNLLDLHNTWPLRRGLLVETIRNFNPDLLGTQECLASQTEYLQDRLSGYDFVGAGRNDGKRRGEMCGVFFRSDRFQLLDSGHFWLSERPGQPGSKGWGAMFPRMVTWVKLLPRDGRSPAFCWFNTHLDAFSSRARLNGAKLLRKGIADIAGAMPVLVTGDFNADEDSGPYRVLLAGAARMNDTFRVINGDSIDAEGTRHGFRGRRGGPRIDWILASEQFRTIDADIDHTRGVIGYPSDHFPVTAVLRPHVWPMVAHIE